MVTHGNKITPKHRGKDYFSQIRLHFTRIFQEYFLELYVILIGAGSCCQLDILYSLINHPLPSVLEYTQHIRVNIKVVIFNIMLPNKNPNRK